MGDPRLLLRQVIDAFHPSDAVVLALRGEGFASKVGTVDYVDGVIEVTVEDGAETTFTVTIAEYVATLIACCDAAGLTEQRDAAILLRDHPDRAARHPAADVVKSHARCARLATLLERQGWTRDGDLLATPAGDWLRVSSWDTHIEFLRSDVERRLARHPDAEREWIWSQRGLLAAIDELLDEERAVVARLA